MFVRFLNVIYLLFCLVSANSSKLSVLHSPAYKCDWNNWTCVPAQNTSSRCCESIATNQIEQMITALRTVCFTFEHLRTRLWSTITSCRFTHVYIYMFLSIIGKYSLSNMTSVICSSWLYVYLSWASHGDGINMRRSTYDDSICAGEPHTVHQ